MSNLKEAVQNLQAVHDSIQTKIDELRDLLNMDDSSDATATEKRPAVKLDSGVPVLPPSGEHNA